MHQFKHLFWVLKTAVSVLAEKCENQFKITLSYLEARVVSTVQLDLQPWEAWSQGYKTFFMLNSTEHDIHHAHNRHDKYNICKLES